MNTFVIPIVTLGLMAMIGVFVLRNPSSEDKDGKAQRVEAKASYRKA